MARTSAVSSVLCLLLIAVNATNATLGQYALLRRRSRQREAPLRIDVVPLWVASSDGLSLWQPATSSTQIY